MPDVSSQLAIFVEFGATAGGSAGAARQLKTITNWAPKDGRNAEPIMAIGVDQAAGIRHMQGGGEITFTSFQTVGKTPECDWRQLKIDRKWFTVTTQVEGNGLRESFLCQVAKIDSKSDAGGVHEDEVTLVFVKRYKS